MTGSMLYDIWRGLLCGVEDTTGCAEAIDRIQRRLRWDGLELPEFATVFTLCSSTVDPESGIRLSSCARYHYDSEGMLRLLVQPHTGAPFGETCVPDNSACTGAEIFDAHGRIVRRNDCFIPVTPDAASRGNRRYHPIAMGRRSAAGDGEAPGLPPYIKELYLMGGRTTWEYFTDTEGTEYSRCTAEAYLISGEDLLSGTLPEPYSRSESLSRMNSGPLAPTENPAHNISCWLNSSMRGTFGDLSTSVIHSLQHRYAKYFWLLKETEELPESVTAPEPPHERDMEWSATGNGAGRISYIWDNWDLTVIPAYVGEMPITAVGAESGSITGIFEERCPFVYISEGIGRIGAGALRGCRDGCTVYIPRSVTCIEDLAGISTVYAHAGSYAAEYCEAQGTACICVEEGYTPEDFYRDCRSSLQ